MSKIFSLIRETLDVMNTFENETNIIKQSLSKVHKTYNDSSFVSFFTIMAILSLLDFSSSTGYVITNLMTSFQTECLSMKWSYDPYHKLNVSARINI